MALVETAHTPTAVAGRVGLAHGVHWLLLRGTLEEVLAGLKDVEVRPGSLRVTSRLPSGHDSRELTLRIASDLTKGRRVDLEHPDHEYRFILGREAYLVEVGGWVARSSYEARRVARRAYHLPISLHPRLARALVNLSGVAKGHTLLDPFAGTGGVLIEAALVGAVALGGDIREEAVEGGRRALEALGLRADLRRGDVEEVLKVFPTPDTVVTDPPYGRSTTTRGEGVEALLRRTFKLLASSLEGGTRLAMVLPGPGPVAIAREHMGLLEEHPLRVHRSLVRHFVVLKV